MKLTKELSQKHLQAKELVKKEELTYLDKCFILENFHEGAESMNGLAGAFFTPLGLARDFCIEIYHAGRTIDLCAGIGMLSFIAYHHYGVKDITCVELNPAYLEIGKKILPEANWVLGSVLDKDLIMSLGTFQQAISNPPFGNVKTEGKKDWLTYKGSDFEYKVIDIASKIARAGTFILPQMSTPFKYSGNNSLEPSRSSKYEAFSAKTGITFEFNCGIDTECYRKQWKGVSPRCEIVLTTFDPELRDPEPVENPEPEIKSDSNNQITLF